MGKKKKRNKPAPDKQNNTLNALPVSGPGLHIHDAPNQKNNSDKSNQETKPMRNPMQVIVGWWNHLGDSPNSNRVVAIFTIIIAATSAVYGVFACLQWSVMNDTFIAANKPSVGLNGIAVLHHGFDKDGKLISSPNKTPETDRLAITAEIKNFGTVAAEDFGVTWDGYLNGIKQPSEKRETPPQTIFPGRLVYLSGATGIKVYPDIMSGKSVLEIHITVRYKGPTKSYAYCEIDRYVPINNAFADVGSCPVTEP